MMLVQLCFIAALLVAADDTSSEAPDDGQASLQEVWQAIFDRAAGDYELFRDKEHTQRLRLRATPVYKWTAPIATSGVFGAVYVWTHEGCVENVSCFWRAVYDENIVLTHELHSLSPVTLSSGRTGSHLDTFAEYEGKNVWKSVRGINDTILHSADNTYFLFGEPAPE